jgi:VanZ family protein
MSERKNAIASSIWLVAACFGLILILVLSLVPGSIRPHTGASRYVEHFIAYLLVALAFAFGIGSRKKAFWIVCGMSVLSVLLEILQIHIPGRSPEVGGAISSSAGAGMGGLLAICVRSLSSKRIFVLRVLKARKLWLLAGGICFCAMAAAALAPGSFVIRSPLGGQYDHFVGYLAVALAFGLAIRSLRSHLLLAIGMTAMALLFETAQHFVPGRSFNWNGFVWSSAGAWVGVVLATSIRWLYRRLRGIQAKI